MSRPKSLLRQVRYEEKIPQWALPYLINGDPLESDDDENRVNLWFENFEARREARGEGAFITLSPTSEPSEPYFCGHPAFGLACDVEDYVICINYYPKHITL